MTGGGIVSDEVRRIRNMVVFLQDVFTDREEPFDLTTEDDKKITSSIGLMYVLEEIVEDLGVIARMADGETEVVNG